MPKLTRRAILCVQKDGRTDHNYRQLKNNKIMILAEKDAKSSNFPNKSQTNFKI